jgi:FkbM family methyltransferase
MLADLVIARLSSDYLWPTLMDQLKPAQRADLVVVEVGAFDGFQASLAAQRGFGLIVLEPSPKNFKRVLKRVGLACPTPSACNTKRGVQIFNVAGSSHNHTLLFASKGGTGDHALGEGGAIALGEEEVYAGTKRRSKPGNKPTVVSVPALPLDHFIANNTGVFITKIDVQDHEPAVLSGMKECIAKRVSDFILIEFRPQGWHHMFPHLDPSKILDSLCAADSGYVCFFLNRSQQGNWNDFEWQFSLSEWIMPNETATTSSLVSRMYAANAKRKDRFGIWTDICAVADRPSAWTVLNAITSVECVKNNGNFSVLPNGRPQCRPTPI